MACFAFKNSPCPYRVSYTAEIYTSGGIKVCCTSVQSFVLIGSSGAELQGGQFLVISTPRNSLIWRVSKIV